MINEMPLWNLVNTFVSLVVKPFFTTKDTKDTQRDTKEISA